MDAHTTHAAELAREVDVLTAERDTALTEVERLAAELATTREQRAALWQLCKQQAHEVRMERFHGRGLRAHLESALAVVGSYHCADPEYAGEGCTERPPAGHEQAACEVLTRAPLQHDRAEDIADSVCHVLQQVGHRVDTIRAGRASAADVGCHVVESVADGGHGRACTITVRTAPATATGRC